MKNTKELLYFSFEAPFYAKDTGVKHTDLTMGEQIVGFVDTTFDNRETYRKYQKSYAFEYLPEDLELNKFELHPKSKLTSVLNSMFLNNSGLFVSPELHKLLLEYKIYSGKFNPIKLKRGAESIDWYYLQLLHASKDLIDYKLSEFSIISKSDKGDIVGLEDAEIADYSDFITKNRDRIINKTNKFVVIKKCVLKGEYDLLTLPFQENVFVSAELKEQLRKHFIKWDTFKEFTAYSISAVVGA